MPFIIEIQKGCWLAKGTGDPPRTLVKKSAASYKTEAQAKAQLTRIRREYPRRGFPNATIEEI